MKKKFLAGILILSILLSMGSFAVVAEEYEAEYEDYVQISSKYDLETGFLTKIGLIDEDFGLTNYITKAEMAKLIAKAMHPEMDFSQALDGDAFSDVPSTHEFYSYIRACKDLGIVKGDYDNNFNPDNQLTAIEAMTMMINALGYTPYAEAFGGYPTGYFQVASSTGISKGLSLTSSESVTGADAAKIVYNSLFADLIQMQGISNGSVELAINKEKNLLSERLGIYEYEATVVDNGIGSIYDSSINDPEKTVIKDSKTGKNIVAYIGDTNVNQYLGYKVKAFVRNNPETGRNEFVYVTPHASYEAITVNAKYIFNVNADYVEYDKDIETADYEKIAIGGVTPVIIVNGVKVTAISGQTSEPLLKQVMPKDGLVTFIENTGDAYYDVVNIISFNYFNGSYKSDARNIVVESVINEEDECSISCSYNPSQSLDLSEDEAGFVFVGNGIVESFADLGAGMIVSVGECPELIDGKPYYYLVVSNETVETTISGKSGNIIVIEDGSEFEISSSLMPTFINYMPMGKMTTLYLDATGKVAYSECEEGSAKNYAYILKAVKRPYAGRDSVIIKAFTKDGEMIEARLTDKCKIDGVAYSNAQAQADAINKRTQAVAETKMSGDDREVGRPAIVDINSDGYVIRIDTDNPNVDLGYTSASTYENATPVVKSDFYSQQHLISYSEEDVASFETLNAGFRNPKASSPQNKKAWTVEGKFFITANTTIIHAAEIDTHGEGVDVYTKFSPAYDGIADNYRGHSKRTLADILSEEGDEEDYSIIKSADLATDIRYDMQAYDIDPDTLVAGLVVIRGDVVSSTVTASTPPLVYSKKTSVYDVALEKTVDKLYFYSTTGEETSVLYDSESVAAISSKLVEKFLKVGDLVRVLQDENGYLTYIDRLESIDKIIAGTTKAAKLGTGIGSEGKPTEDGIMESVSGVSISYQGNTRALGYVNKINGSVAEMVVGDDETELKALTSYVFANSIPANRRFYLNFQKLQPLIIDFSNSDMKVETGRLSDIKTVKEATDTSGNVNLKELDLVLCRQTRFTPNLVIVYRGLDISSHIEEE